MGNREDLLSGAKRCLYEKGYARTTARDIAAASGTSLASIGYHFKTTEALMNAALIEAMDEWGHEVQRALATVDPAATPTERFEAAWTRTIESLTKHRRMFVATFEIFPQIEHAPEVRRTLAEGMNDARTLWARLFQGIDAAAEPKKAHAVGSFYQALLSGVMAQWLIDPEHAPSARELADALRVIAASVEPAEKAGKGGAAAAKSASKGGGKGESKGKKPG